MIYNMAYKKVLETAPYTGANMPPWHFCTVISFIMYQRYKCIS